MANGDSTRKVGLVLSGGGAFGAYEVGAIKALYSGQSPATASAPLDPDVFSGTSVGNFNAAVLAMNKGGAQASAKRLHDIWTNDVADNDDGRGNGVYRMRGNPADYLDPRVPGGPLELFQRIFGDATTFGGFAARRAWKFFFGEGRQLHRAANFVDVSLLLDIDPFEKLVRNSIDPTALRESPKDLRVEATNWTTGKAEAFRFQNVNRTDDETWHIIRASAAIPCLFPPVKMLSTYFIDGGVVMNTPIKPAIDRGATEIHVVILDPTVAELPRGYAENTWDAFNRVYMAMMAAKITADIVSAESVNKGIDIIERAAAGEIDAGDAKRFLGTAKLILGKLEAEGSLPRKLTIHRYYPKRPLGGMLGMLNFHRPAIDALIEEGYNDVLAHNCGDNKCVIPQAVKAAQSAAAGSQT